MDLSNLFNQYRYSFRNEKELQDQLACIMNQNHISFSKEYTTAQGVYDFWVDSTVIEVKIKGSPDSVLRQIKRYMEDSEVKKVLLVTTKRNHQGIHNVELPKPLQVCLIERSLM